MHNSSKDVGRETAWLRTRAGIGQSAFAGAVLAVFAAGVAAAAPPARHYPGDDIPLVRIDPHAVQKPPTPAARRDAARAKADMKAQLQEIDAAALLLQHGFVTRSLAEITNVKDTMQRLDDKLIARVPRLHGDPWPEAEDTAFSDCEDAAGTLNSLATNPTAAATVAEVAERRRELATFKQKDAACHAWVYPRPHQARR